MGWIGKVGGGGSVKKYSFTRKCKFVFGGFRAEARHSDLDHKGHSSCYLGGKDKPEDQLQGSSQEMMSAKH